MSQGNSARSVTSVAARVRLELQQPKPPTRSGVWAIIRWAASLAFSALSAASNGIRRSFAPPRAFMPPASLTSSMASSAPSFSRIPERAHGPLRGTSMAILTSAGACARACDAREAAESARAERRLRLVIFVASRFVGSSSAWAVADVKFQAGRSFPATERTFPGAARQMANDDAPDSRTPFQKARL